MIRIQQTKIILFCLISLLVFFGENSQAASGSTPSGEKILAQTDSKLKKIWQTTATKVSSDQGQEEEEEDDFTNWEKAYGMFPDESYFDGINLINPQSGFVSVEGTYNRYFRYRATLTGPNGGTIIFTKDNCILYAPGGTPYGDYYVRIVTKSEGTRISLTGKADKRNFRVRENPDRPFDLTPWNTIMLSTPSSKLQCVLPKGGFLVFDIIWRVPSNFYFGGVDLLGKTVRPSKQAKLKQERKPKPTVGKRDVPKSRITLKGDNRINIANKTKYSVVVMFRDNSKGIDVKIAPQEEESVSLPDGDEQVFIVYSADDETVYKSDVLKLRERGGDMEILESADGNYDFKSR